MSNIHAAHNQPERGYDIMRPAPEPQKEVKSGYANPAEAKHNAAPQLFDIKGKAIYDQPDLIDWFTSHPEDKPCLQPSPAMAVPMPVLAPSDFEKAAISDMVTNSPSMQPLSEKRLTELAAMGKQPDVSEVESPIYAKLRAEILDLEAKQRFENAEVQ